MHKKLTILIVDDTETNIDILIELLDEKYDLVVAINGKTALEVVKKDKIDLILLDIMMPEMDGYEVCEILKSNQSTKDIPVIFITAKTDEESIEKAYEVGGIDYIAKPFKPRELLARVKTTLKLKSLIEHLEYISAYDVLSSIYNRRKFFELSELKFAQESHNLYAVMIDIDYFKLVNDTYGHSTGDKAIKLIAQTILKIVEKDSIFGRLGGEEFGIICDMKSSQDIAQKVELMRSEVEALKLFSDSSNEINITISIGYAKNTKEITSLDQLLKEADISLYKAKDSGRNRVIFRT